MRKQFLTAAAILSAMMMAAQAQNQGLGADNPSVAKSAMQPAGADHPVPSKVATAADFVPMAAIGNTFEIQSSNLALQKSKSAAIRDFATKMGEDHSTAAANLDQAVARSPSGPQVPLGLDARHEDLLRQLDVSNTPDFDALYVKMQTEAHDEAIALFEAYSNNGPDGPLKDFAAKTLPTLKKHRRMIDDIAAS